MANELQFFLDTPVAFGTALAAADYDATTGTVIGSTATNGTIIYKRLSGACGLTIKHMGFVVTVAVTGGTAVVLTCYVNPTVGSTTARRTVGTITIASGTAIGDAVFGTFGDDDISVNPGEEVTLELTTKATTAGAGYVSAGYNCFHVGPTSGGTATVPKVTTKPYGAVKVGQVKLVTSGTTAN
jgi:hypothetical protein